MVIMELRNVVVVVFIFSMLLSCNKQPDKKELPVINLNSISAINDSITLSLDDLGWKEKLIPLETNDSCLLADISVICESINNYWIVSNGEVLKFDKEGRYDRRIGKVGQGPEEYGSAYSFKKRLVVPSGVNTPFCNATAPLSNLFNVVIKVPLSLYFS